MLLQSQPVRLQFDGRSQLRATDLYSTDPTERRVGTISLSGGSNSIDMIQTGAFRSGKIAALIEARDKTLTGVQSQLDEVAARSRRPCRPAPPRPPRRWRSPSRASR